MARRDWLERFWAKVDQSGGPDACWPWTGAYNTPMKRPWKGTRRPIFRLSNGAGVKRHGQLVIYAHRLMLSLHDGVPLDERNALECCHTCNNPRCVNPAHLRWDTPEANRRDRYGDRARGTNVPVPSDRGE